MANYAVIKAPRSYPSWKAGDIISDGTYTIATLEGESGVFTLLDSVSETTLARLKSAVISGGVDPLLVYLFLLDHLKRGPSLSAATIVGAATVGTTLGVTGETTLTGGLVATRNVRHSNIPIGGVALGSLGTDAVHVAGTTYRAEIELDANDTLTGIAVLNGTTVGTDKLIVALYSSAGVLLASSALAGTTTSGADAFQEIPFTAPYAAVGPARYFILIQCNGTTDKTRRIAASTYLNCASSAVGVFGTLPASFTPPTTTAADTGPIGYVY